VRQTTLTRTKSERHHREITALNSEPKHRNSETAKQSETFAKKRFIERCGRNATPACKPSSSARLIENATSIRKKNEQSTSERARQKIALKHKSTPELFPFASPAKNPRASHENRRSLIGWR
jgi:hypothetical protein